MLFVIPTEQRNGFNNQGGFRKRNIRICFHVYDVLYIEGRFDANCFFHTGPPRDALLCFVALLLCCLVAFLLCVLCCFVAVLLLLLCCFVALLLYCGSSYVAVSLSVSESGRDFQGLVLGTLEVRWAIHQSLFV